MNCWLQLEKRLPLANDAHYTDEAFRITLVTVFV